MGYYIWEIGSNNNSKKPKVYIIFSMYTKDVYSVCGKFHH